jgi:two-component system, cell cycle response regulator
MGSMSQNSPSLNQAPDIQQFECPQCGLYSPLADELMALREQVITDPLTGLFNVRHFRSALDKELERTLRSGVPTALMMIDLDHFKQVNDQWGHEVGNHVLKMTARLIGQATRQLDIQCRYGGEEFVVILPSTSLLLASQVAERLRELIEHAEMDVDGQALKVTTSIGLSVRLANERGSADRLIKEADECLYQAKHSGRNKVFFHSAEKTVEAAVNSDEKEALLGMFSDYFED